MNLQDARGFCNVLEQLGLELCEIIADLLNEEIPGYRWGVTKNEFGSWFFWVDPVEEPQDGPARIGVRKH